MPKFRLIPVILSGGTGSRLWPLSRKKHPKPFIKTFGKYTTLLQSTLMRAMALPQVHDIVTVTSSDLLSETKIQYQALASSHKQLVRQHFILEPCGRNTAPAITVACLWVHKTYGDDAILLVLPADHVIADESLLAEALHQATLSAADGKLATLGIKPTSASSAYGYIEHDATKVLRFIEKPPPGKALEYFQKGGFLWNSGMFCFTAGTMLADLSQHCPDILEACRECLGSTSQNRRDGSTITELTATAYTALRSDSIDYAVMEHTSNAAVITCNPGWDDVGDWKAFGNLQPADQDDNRLQGEVIIQNSHGCTIHANHDRVVAAVGLQDLVVVDTEDALLVLHKANTQQVKSVYNILENRHHPTHTTFRTVEYAWGQYIMLDNGPGFVVGRIILWEDKGFKLELPVQRTGHWTIIQGTAAVTLHDSPELILQENQSATLKGDQRHCLKNHQSQPLIVIEIQTGNTLAVDTLITAPIQRHVISCSDHDLAPEGAPQGVPSC